MAILQQTTPTVNPEHLNTRLKETYQLVCDLAKRTGACYASAAWLSQRLSISESQLSRRLKTLASFGLIAVEHLRGLARLVKPLSFFAEAVQAQCAQAASVLQEKCRLPTIRDEASKKADTEKADAAVVALLCKQGVSEEIADRLALADVVECRRQLDFLPLRKDVRDPAATLVKAIQKKWNGPAQVETNVAYPFGVVSAPVSRDRTDADTGSVLDKIRAMRHGLKPYRTPLTEAAGTDYSGF